MKEKMEERILDILKETLDLDTVDKSCSQETCAAWDSMGQLNLAAELEDAFEVSLEPNEIREMKSYKDIVRILRGKGVKD